VSSTWQGWATDFLKAAQLPTTSANIQFLHDWSARKHSDCDNNPIDLTYDSGNATKCQKTGIRARPWYQSYKHHGNALDAWTSQFIVVGFDALAAALESGDPYGVDYFARVTKDLSRWGSGGFASYYYHRSQSSAGQVNSAKLHKGWAALQKTFNVGMPHSLKHARHVHGHGLRLLHRARKVRL